MFGITEQELQVMNNLPKGVLPDIDPYGDTIFYIDHINFVCDNIQIMTRLFHLSLDKGT